MHFVRQEPAITEWEDMKAKLQDEYLPQYFRAKYLPQSSCGHSQDRKDNFRHRNSQPIVQFEENKVNVHSVSSPTLSPTRENLRKIIQDEIKASQKETNNSEVSHTRDISVEPSNLSATVEVPDLQVQEEELIVEPKQQVFEDTQLDEVDKVVSFSSPIPHIEFIIPDKFNDVMESKAPLFSVLPTVVPELKQVFRVRLLLLQHYKTRG
uniref:Retrotransposon gag domain-containing protein n=1 Tax=Fagus sylvatica TaxID=28930 RepID=A0A2N9HRH3_FAGSY